MQPDLSERSTPPATVPRFNRDPAASLQPACVEFTFAGEDFSTVLVTAADWLGVLLDLEQSLLDVFHSMLGPEQAERFIRLYLEQGGDIEELLFEVLEVASARYWWVTLRLLGVVQGSWHQVGASLLKQGVRPSELSFAGFLDVFTFELVHTMKPESVTMIMMQIEMPPDGYAMPEEDMEMSADDFLSLG
jgi:hypothetical protein